MSRQLRQALHKYVIDTKITKKAFEKKISDAMGGDPVPPISCRGTRWNATPANRNTYLHSLVSMAMGGTICGNLKVPANPKLKRALMKIAGLSVQEEDIGRMMRRGVRAKGLPESLTSYQGLVLRLVPVGRASVPDMRKYIQEYGPTKQPADLSVLRKEQLQGLVFDIQQSQSAQDLYNAALAFSDGKTIRPDILRAVEVATRRNESQAERLRKISESAYLKLKTLSEKPELSSADKQEIKRCMNMFGKSSTSSTLRKVATGASAVGAGLVAAAAVSRLLPGQENELQRRFLKFPVKCWKGVLGMHFDLTDDDKAKIQNDPSCSEEWDQMQKLATALGSDDKEVYDSLRVDVGGRSQNNKKFINQDTAARLVSKIAKSERDSELGRWWDSQKASNWWQRFQKWRSGRSEPAKTTKPTESKSRTTPATAATAATAATVEKTTV